MTKSALAVFVFLLLSSIGYASEDLKAIVGSYLEIHAALASDKLEGVKAPARAVATRAAVLGARGASMAKAATAVADAPDLKAARDAFVTLTDAIIAVGKAEGWQDLSGIKIGFCPMANRSWIQKKGVVANPYYGKSMLTCGTLTDPGK